NGGTEIPSPEEITPTTSDVEVAQASSGTVEEPLEATAAPSETSEAAAPAAPRNRRRTTRRPAAAAEPGAEASPPAPEDVAAPPATAPEGEIVTPAGEASSTNGAAPTEDAAKAATRTPRPRRVASA